MFCKPFVALILWCHCYQIVLNPLLQLLLAIGLKQGDSSSLLGSNDITHFSHPGLYVSGSPIIVEANQVAFTPGHEIVLRCNIAEYPDVQFYWVRIRQYSNREIAPPVRIEEEMKPVNNRYIMNNNVLILKSPTHYDVGDYYCRVKNPSDGMENQKMISVRARPYVLDFELESSTLLSATIEEGKQLKIVCNVVDDFVPESSLRVNWQMSKYDENDMNDVISDEEGIRIESYNSTSQALIIDRITKDHRRFYKCQVNNGVTDNSKVILIRVRDKYLVLWPFIGIILEIVILIAIICVVENRKVEPDKDSYDRKAIQM